MVCDVTCYSAALPTDGRKPPSQAPPSRGQNVAAWHEGGKGVCATSLYVGRGFPCARPSTRACAAQSAWPACSTAPSGSPASPSTGGASRPGASGAVRSWTTRCSCSTSSCPSPGSSRRFWSGTPVALGGWRLLSPLASAALYHIFTGVMFGLSTSLGLVNIAPAAAPTVGLAGACTLPGLIVGMVFDTRAWTRR